MSTRVIALGTGRCSDFGGPFDGGVSPTEGLGLVEVDDLHDDWFARCFLTIDPDIKPPVGLARRLNPQALYCAMRWNFTGLDSKGGVLFGFSREQIRRGIFRVLAANGRSVFVQAVDDGPNEHTGRLIDLSPEALAKLQIGTDDLVTVEFIS